MIRGTTIPQLFELNIDLRGATVYVTYQQDGVNVIEKTNSDLEISDTGVLVHLSQADTLKLSDKMQVLIQLRWVFPDGTADATAIMRRNVEGILKDGEI